MGTWDFDGEDVVITVLDNKAVQHWENDGVASSRIGIDAIAMRCTLRCDSRPGVPSGVTFQNGRAVWNAVSGATSYDVISWPHRSEGTIRTGVACCQFTLPTDADSFGVRAVNSAGTSDWSRSVQIGTIAQIPGRVNGTGSRISSHGPLIYWQPVSGVEHYEIDARERPTDRQDYRGDFGCAETQSECGYLFKRDRSTSQDFRDANQFRIRAVNSAGAGPWSNWVRVPAEIEPPDRAAVAGFRESSHGPLIYWQPVSGVEHYEIDARERPTDRQDYRGDFGCVETQSECGYLFKRDRSTSQDFRDANQFRIRAVNSAGAGPWSNWVTVPADTEPPDRAAVAGFRESSHGPLIYWQPVSGVEHYEIDARERPTDRQDYRGDIGCVETQSECGYLFKRDRSTSQDFRDANQFRIRAVNSAGAGPWSNWVTVPAEIEAPARVTGVRYRSGHVEWNNPRGAVSYEIHIKHKIIGISRHTFCSDCRVKVDRKVDRTVYVRVRAHNVAGYGPWSDLLRIEPITPRLTSVPEITKLDIHTNYFPGDAEDVTVTWETVSGATSYKIQWR